jgi:hypothetical protein
MEDFLKILKQLDIKLMLAKETNTFYVICELSYISNTGDFIVIMPYI